VVATFFKNVLRNMGFFFVIFVVVLDISGCNIMGTLLLLLVVVVVDPVVLDDSASCKKAKGSSIVVVVGGI
jgi:hypothetical protein